MEDRKETFNKNSFETPAKSDREESSDHHDQEDDVCPVCLSPFMKNDISDPDIIPDFINITITKCKVQSLLDSANKF
jgi:hypothetical protein